MPGKRHVRERPEVKPVRAVLFDFGGTLFGYSLDGGAAIFAAIADLGCDARTPETMEVLRKAFSEVSLTYAQRQSYLHRDLFNDQLVRAAELLGVDAPSKRALERFEADNRSNIINRSPLKDDATAVLRALKDRDIYRAVVSNADDDFLEPTLTKNGLDVLLDDWTSSEEAKSCKPDPKIFEHALAKAGVAREEALFVGDSLQHDIAGASRCGMRTVLIANGLDAAPLSHGLDAAAEPDFQVQTLVELLAIVDELNDSA